MENLKKLSREELRDINGGGWGEFWDAVFDYFGVPEEVRPPEN